MNWIVAALAGWAELAAIEEGLAAAGASRVRVEGVVEPAKALLVAGLARGSAAPILVISPTSESAERMHQDVRALLDDVGESGTRPKVLLLPSLEALLYEDVAPDPALVGDRLLALRALLTGEPVVVVTSPPAAFQRSLPPHTLSPTLSTFSVGGMIERDGLVRQLVGLGYEREEMVTGPGQFSVRGGVVDIYLASASWPVRMELFGDEVESLRTFDPATQRSVSDLDGLSLIPAREVLLTDEALTRGIPLIEKAAREQAAGLASQGREAEAVRLRERSAELLEALRQGAYTSGLEYLLPFLYPDPTTVLDYLPPDAVVVVDEPDRVPERYAEFVDELNEIAEARIRQGMLLATPAPLHVPWEEAEGLLAHRRVLELRLLGGSPGRGRVTRVEITSQHMTAFAGDVTRLSHELKSWQQQGVRVLMATRQADRLIEMLDEAGVGGLARERPDLAPRPGQVVLSERLLSEGFYLPGVRLAVLTDREVFGWRKLYQPYRRRAATGVPLHALTDLTPGDYVVHINHGIGVYRGLVRGGPGAGEREYLLIEYAGEDRLYVPTEQFDRVQKYLGGDEQPPQIHRLGGSEWERAKRRARRSAQEMAAELLRIYASRQRQPGHAFGADTVWQREMEDGFMFEETPDQLAAIADVKTDMEAERPMDRLVCGDVGFGKTEVAIRAAFKAVMDGMQVAVLAPTTVLAQQHYTTFSERLAAYPVRIELLSRFRSQRDQRRVVEELTTGAVDIVIGTHRLLSKDVEFKRLGVVVIDEEQRFGVRHKERLKQLRTTVDVVTLTATPIPRTLHMSLSGIRDISLINDPPEGRIAIITRAIERDDSVVREAILRELERGGQVYYLHNRVDSIGHVSHHLQQLVPHARIAVAHGQMDERELEHAMLDFYAGEAQILVSTTIIENGLDIPNANTLIVGDADRLGLAQLYQLRGRVGRSSRQAYAYLMWTPFKRLTEAAEKRIAAIREFSQLGSGFKIALRDLEIRGAGNLLGPEQHGFVASVGFELYMQMLADAVQEARGEEAPARLEVSVDLPVSAYLPQEYAPDLNQRIELYRRLATAPDHQRIDDLAGEIADRFGRPLPLPVQSLVRLARLKVRCAAAGVARATTDGNLAVLMLSDGRRLTPPLASRLKRALSYDVQRWLALAEHDRVIVSIRNADTEGVFARLEQTLEQLALLPLEEEARRHQRRQELVAGRSGGRNA
jgi:transcription-repair coupling factor (superfamily II helicase)